MINDPRTCNRIVIYRPQTNILSQLELISLWEHKTGRNFKRIQVSEEELVKLSQSKNFDFLFNFLFNKIIHFYVKVIKDKINGSRSGTGMMLHSMGPQYNLVGSIRKFFFG